MPTDTPLKSRTRDPGSDSQLAGLGRRQLMRGAMPLALVASSGCFGSFSMTRAMHGWIGSWKSKWLSWLGFLGFVIIGAYGISTLVDGLVLNAIEFFTGKPVFDNKHTQGKINTLADGSTIHGDGNERLVSVPSEDGNRLRVEHWVGDERVRAVDLHREVNGVELREDGGKVLVRADTDGDVLRIRDGDGRSLMSINRREAEAVADAVERGESLTGVLTTVLARNARHHRMLAGLRRRGTGV